MNNVKIAKFEPGKSYKLGYPYADNMSIKCTSRTNRFITFGKDRVRLVNFEGESEEVTWKETRVYASNEGRVK